MVTQNKTMKIGFIGLGRMGSGMAGRLLVAGHELTVYNRTPDKAKPFAMKGARMAAKISEACSGDAVITMLSDDEALESVAYGDGGILQSLRKGAVHVSMSTISVALSEKLTAAHELAGQRFVSATVFGRPDAAAAGKLFIITAGEQDVAGMCAPLFMAMGQKTFHVGGEPRAANLVKLSGNFLIASTIEALSEAMALISKGGIDQRRYLEVLTSTLFTGPVFANYGALIAERRFEPATFAAKQGEKDVRFALAAAQTLRAPMPLASLLHDRFLTLLARGGEDLDWSAIGGLAASDVGLDVLPKAA
jgi:3-hydroxyisobutyrate dehydrogenase-like beta-hydroxyacid dehydrogenase